MRLSPHRTGRALLAEPSRPDVQRLERVAGRVFGTGCVVSDHYAPDRDRPASRDQQAGLCLVDAYEPGDPAAWLVNERVTRRQCAACASRITDLPEHHVPPQWTPRQAWATKGRSQVPVDQGPTATRARGPHAGDLRERHSGSPAAE
ncbi:hypothetical protein [Streptomyces tailanensis]|uniref:hypothetical protein n=1 Tax=Streptomyces tailanensis TaxID=2569858 RepID=UPI00122DCEBF|nr:hypothetical protein [Streptomyces tailanensis]